MGKIDVAMIGGQEKNRVREALVEPAVRSEFPELRLHYTEAEVKGSRSSREIRERLDYMSERISGQRAIALRQEPIPFAYRVFFHHIGLDPDKVHTPVESVVVERLQKGRLRSSNLVEDALKIAILDTGVALWAYDAENISGDLMLRQAAPGERLGPGGAGGQEIREGTLVTACDTGMISLLFGSVADDFTVKKSTRSLLVCALQVEAVPEVAIHEAIWICRGVIEA